MIIVESSNNLNLGFFFTIKNGCSQATKNLLIVACNVTLQLISACRDKIPALISIINRKRRTKRASYFQCCGKSMRWIGLVVGDSIKVLESGPRAPAPAGQGAYNANSGRTTNYLQQDPGGWKEWGL